jgi:shikimate kinase/3-dehydroquinate synthase
MPTAARNRRRSIVLSGFMATGKTTVGQALAARLGLPFVDTDAVLTERTGRSVPDLWRSEGEAAFRARESELAAELLSVDEPQVIAFGGGTVTVKETRRLALERALVVTLTARPETVAARVVDLSKRPNLAVGGDPVARAAQLIADRAAAYAEAHAQLSTDDLDPEEVVDEIRALAERDPLVMPLGERSYALDFVIGAPARVTDAIASLAPSSLVVVTDSHVQRARGAALDKVLKPLALPVTRVSLSPGESQKVLASAGAIWDAALGAGVDRDALVVSFGGGVVGDLAGFAAATLLRGVRVLHVPTTLLSMVDSSVGGKTGIDHPAGKNLVGAFHQPSAVVIDLAHLTTLPKREIRAGLAEIVKIAITSDAALLETIEAQAISLTSGDLEALAPVVRAAVRAKIALVQDDERETTGQRAILNFGHTLGHAIETFGGFERWIHGEAVALGTVAELAVGVTLGKTPPALVKRIRALFGRLGLATDLPAAELLAALPHLARDKKRVKDGFKLPLVHAAGHTVVEYVSRASLEAAVRQLAAEYTQIV